MNLRLGLVSKRACEGGGAAVEARFRSIVAAAVAVAPFTFLQFSRSHRSIYRRSSVRPRSRLSERGARL